MTLSGANTYNGTTSVQDGILSVSSLNKVSGGALSSNLGAPTTVASGTIHLGATTTTGQLTYTGSGEITDRVINLLGTTGGATLDQSGNGTLKFTAAFTATGAGNKTLTLQGSTAGTGEIAGAIVNNSGNMTSVSKSGTGTWVLSGTNTYTGNTTVSVGTLLINGGSSGATGAMSVASGATLGGTGTLGGDVAVSGSLLGGDGTTGTALTSAKNIALASGSSIVLTLGPGLSHSSLIRTGGTWTFDAAQIFAFNDLGATAGSYTGLITGLGADPGTSGWTIANGWSGNFSYSGGSVNLDLTAVPEPSTCVLLAFALTTAVVFRRRRV